jgi:hypothetical protein
VDTDSASNPGSPARSGTGPRTPHWTGRVLQVKNATPLYTGPLLNKANHFYKMFILITHPFPELTNQRRHFAKDAWDAAHEMLEDEESIVVKFTTDIEVAVSMRGLFVTLTDRYAAS